MSALVPNRQLVRFEFPLRRRTRRLTIDGDLSDWPEEYSLPALCRLDGVEPFAPVYAAWDAAGLYIACEVHGKRQPLRCDPKAFWKGDNLRLCTDMRDARDVKRATRYCQQFYFLATGATAGAGAAVAGGARIHRAREHAPLPKAGQIVIAASVSRNGYALEAHIPAACLSGFDPTEHRRIGFYTMLEDRDRGQQYLTIGDDLNWWVDPSTWATAVLVD